MAQDDYESQYMLGDEEIVFRERLTAPGWYHGMYLAIILALMVPSLFTLDPILIGIMAATSLLMAFIWAFFAVMRVHLSSKNLHIQLGLTGPKIATDHITHAAPVKLDGFETKGWGVKKQTDGSWYYGMRSDVLDAVKITYFDESKKECSAIVATQFPQEFLDALEKTRQTEQQITLDFSSSSQTHEEKESEAAEPHVVVSSSSSLKS